MPAFTALVTWRNNGDLIRSWVESRGYKVFFEERGQNIPFDKDVVFLWKELRAHIDWKNLPRNTLVNKLSERIALCEKAGLYRSVMKIHGGVRPGWIPQTFVLPHDSSAVAAEARKLGNETFWIVKPNGKNRGNGITIVSSTDLPGILKNPEPETVVQRYLRKPMLLNGKKFDMRMYLLISCRKPFTAYFAPGYVRRSVREYCDPLNDLSDLSVHLTNQSVQKAKCPEYLNDANVKDDSVWTLDQMLAASGESQAWLSESLIPKVEKMATVCALAIKASLKAPANKWKEWELFGFDVIVDDEQPYLLEVNTNPALFTNTSVLNSVIPPVVHEALELALRDNGGSPCATCTKWVRIVHE